MVPWFLRYVTSVLFAPAPHGPCVSAGARAALVVVCLLGSVPARAERVALLPLEGAGLLTKTRTDLDGELRAALTERGLTVQPREATEEQITEAQGAGLGNCPLTSDPCVRRVGQIAEVDTVFRATIEIVDERMVLSAARLEVRGEEPARRVAGQIQLPAIDEGKSLRAVLERAISGTGEPSPLPFTLQVVPADAELTLDGKRIVAGTLWLKPGAHALVATAPGYGTLTRELLVREDGDDSGASLALTPEVVTVPVMRYVGLGLLGVGGLALVSGGVAASLAEAALNTPLDLAQRDALRGFGAGSLVAAGAGATFAAVGGVFAVMGGSE